MASDYLDYENNLAFPPQEVKSQDDVKHQDTRSSDVLIKAVEECEKLEKENQQLKELLKECKHIIEWYKGTGLNPYLSVLNDKEKNEFTEEILCEIKKKYECRKNGEVVLRFPRLFFIATKGEI